MRRTLLLVSAVALAAVAAAGAKEGVRATLTSTVDTRAASGGTLHVEGKLADRSGRPFGAGGVFVRLLGRSGGSTFAFAGGTDGVFSAQIRVPTGGIGGIRVGLRGHNDYGVADVYFPVVNDPFRSPAGVRCDVAAVARALRAFTETFTRGGLQRLDGLFARGERFAWFSSGAPGPRFSPEAGKRETLVRYFAARHREHDRMGLVSYRFNGYEAPRVIGHFELRATRSADDYRGGAQVDIVGKGAIDCSASPVRFMVLSLGGP
jgi:hypothetical protein